MSEIKEYQTLCQAAEMAERLSESVTDLFHFLEQHKENKIVAQILSDHVLESVKNTIYACHDALHATAYVKGRKAIKEFNSLPNV